MKSENSTKIDGRTKKQIFHPDKSDSRDFCGFEWETRYTWESLENVKKQKMLLMVTDYLQT